MEETHILQGGRMKPIQNFPQIAYYFIGSFLILPNLAWANPSSGKIHRQAKPIAGHYIVILKNPNQAGGLRVNSLDMAATMSSQYKGKVKHIFQHATQGFSIEMNESQMKALAQDES